jgi:hypothetical protein
MAIHLEANYSKKLGLPGYSSHQYSVTIKTEVADPAKVEAESNRLYVLLQTCVDSQIQKTGFLPDPSQPGSVPINQTKDNGQNEAWDCSSKQKDLILDIAQEQNLDKNEIEKLAQDLFGKGVKQLNKLEASGLIDELLGSNGKANGSYRRPYGASRYVRAGGGR